MQLENIPITQVIIAQVQQRAQKVNQAQKLIKIWYKSELSSLLRTVRVVPLPLQPLHDP